MTVVQPKKTAWYKRIWQAEPVLVSTVIPVAATVGVLTATQANAISTAIAAVVEIATAFGIRTQVRPVSAAVPVVVTPAPVAHPDPFVGGVSTPPNANA